MSLNNTNGPPMDISSQLQRLSENDRREVTTAVEHEVQKGQIQSTIHSLTAMCFKKCVNSRISSGKLDKYEEPCLNNCVNRFLDANTLIMRTLEGMQQQGHGV